MNEKLTEEIGRITDKTKTFTDEAGNLVLERFRNPYILTFLISWILFNWKPLSFFIFSEGNVEYKIKFIVTHYSDILYYFFYPFGITMLYLFILPYLNMINEWFLMYSVKKRANYIAQQQIDKIGRDEKIAIADDKMQIAIASAKESTDHNNYINELQDTIQSLQDNLNEERSRNQTLITNFDKHSRQLTDEIIALGKNHNETFIELNNNLIKSQETNRQLSEEKEKLQSDNSTLYKVNSDIQNALKFERFRKERLKDPKTKLVTTLDRTILEYFTSIKEARYFDIEKNQFIEPEEAMRIFDQLGYVEFTEPSEFKSAFEQMLLFMEDEIAKYNTNKSN